MKPYIIIGAGILGASTAYHLAKSGAGVVLIDRKDQGQATDAAAGIVCPWLTQRRNQAWYKLAKAGAKYYSELIAQLEADGETETGYKRVGAISVHFDEEKLTKIEERAFVRREDAPEIGDITRLSPQKAKELFPPLNDEYAGIQISGAARVNGRALRDSLIHAAKKYGAVVLHENASLIWHEKQVIGVQVLGDSLLAKEVIITAGAWANELIQPLGIKFQVFPQKAQIIHLRLEKSDTGQFPLIMPPNNQYILAFDDDRVVIGATHEDNKGYDVNVTAGGIHEILNKALAIAPGLSDGEWIETRVGFRPLTPGSLPVIGPLPGYQGVLVANGLGASGLTVGPYLGGELAKLALGMPIQIDLSEYNVATALG